MTPDKFQEAWRADSSQTRVTVDAELLRKEVERNQRDFRALILRRDTLEITVALLFIPVWSVMGAWLALPWTWYLTEPAMMWVAGFFLVDRWRHPQRPIEPGAPLLTTVRESLRQVDHQIWLLRNVFWWYLLPLFVSELVFFAHVAGDVASLHWLFGLGFGSFLFAFLVTINGFVDYINQRAVRVQLAPRRQELLALLASLDDGPVTEISESSSKGINPARRWFIVALLGAIAAVIMAILFAASDAKYEGPPQSDGPAGVALASLVDDLRKENDLVGLAAMMTVDGRLEAAAASGERKKGSGVAVEIGDRWHLGGITQSITVTMIARLVEAGRMKWSDTVAEVFPNATLDPTWQSITLRQLLTDTSGAPANFPAEVLQVRPPLGRESTRARCTAVLNIMAEKRPFLAGNRYASNVGYTIAGAMAEQVTGDTWEDLVRREVFEPLNLASAGFGPPTSSDAKLEQPRGHQAFGTRKLAVDDKADNTAIMAPSGMVHMTLGDLCTYANEHLRGEQGEGKLLSTETYRLLHTPEFGQNAWGWIRSDAGGATSTAKYWSFGSNTLWYAFVIFVPETKTVVAVTANDGDMERGTEAAWQIVQASAKRFEKEAFAKKSPFAAVRWQESRPEVKIDDQWYQLLSLDGLTTDDILAFSRQKYGNRWQKRFEEDLVELLSRMGHPPQETVKLEVRAVTSQQTQVLQDVSMTAANRQAIKAAANARENAD
ncbi:MAG TPA: serine hydrolase domain-containing protein [Pirellulales bacterium]|jgi:CubicO group peptidase (beta-lactamase class C family)